VVSRVKKRPRPNIDTGLVGARVKTAGRRRIPIRNREEEEKERFWQQCRIL